jgi:phenylacetate 2-hydroxylase
VYGGELLDPLDTDRVEYIKALGTEAGRYFESIRLRFSRETREVVDSVLIPKGVLVVYNPYQINRDPQRYDFPEEFVPERWMEGHYRRTDVKHPKVGVPHLNHDAGRRVCMGVPSRFGFQNRKNVLTQHRRREQDVLRQFRSPAPFLQTGACAAL